MLIARGGVRDGGYITVNFVI